MKRPTANTNVMYKLQMLNLLNVSPIRPPSFQQEEPNTKLYHAISSLCLSFSVSSVHNALFHKRFPTTSRSFMKDNTISLASKECKTRWVHDLYLGELHQILPQQLGLS
jgi:hypothetical protein